MQISGNFQGIKKDKNKARQKSISILEVNIYVSLHWHDLDAT